MKYFLVLAVLVSFHSYAWLLNCRATQIFPNPHIDLSRHFSEQNPRVYFDEEVGGGCHIQMGELGLEARPCDREPAVAPARRWTLKINVSPSLHFRPNPAIHAPLFSVEIYEEAGHGSLNLEGREIAFLDCR